MSNREHAVTRKTFVKGAAATAVAATIGLACAPAARADEVASDADGAYAYEADVVVAGAGLGGLTAAIRCAQEGLRVVCVEASRTSGGGSGWSGGTVSCAFGASLGSAYPGYRSPCEDFDTYEAADYTDDGKFRFNTIHVTLPPQKALLLNLDGKRFVSESAAYYRIHMAMLRQHHATGVYVFDQAYYDEFAEEPDVLYGQTSVSQVEAHKEFGGQGLISADTIEELADKLAEALWNMPRGAFLRTVEEWNAACDDGATGDLDIPYATAIDAATGKPRSATKCATGPFYAWPATPAIYTTFGGLLVDADMHVLDVQKKPIAGRYAAAPVAGGIIREIYTGGMGLAASTAYRAAQTAIEEAAQA